MVISRRARMTVGVGIARARLCRHSAAVWNWCSTENGMCLIHPSGSLFFSFAGGGSCGMWTC